MTDGVTPRLVDNLDQAFGNQRTGDGGAQQIFALVDRVGAEHREDKIACEFFRQVVDIDFLDAHRLRLGPGGLDLLALPDIGGEGDDFAIVGFAEPLQDDGGIQATGVGESDFLDGRIRHEAYLIC